MKAFRRISFKLLAVFLSVLMVLMSFPLSVLAQGVSDEFVKATDSEIGIIEIEDARTADTKRFRLEDGTYMVAQYDTAVHYLDETNTWQDIDNTLTASESEITTENAKIKFAKKTTGNNSLFTLHDGNRKLTLSLNGAAKKVSGVITNHESPLGDDATELQKMTVLHKIMASVIYEDILSGVDLEYVIIGNNIKENIIVKEKQDFYTYTFTMSLNNLMPVLDTTGEIALCDPENGACIWHIPAPVMWDASKQYSNAIEITLTDLGNGKFELTLVADSEWMNDEERTFPVTIDPPIYTNHTRVKDIYISGRETEGLN